MFPKVGSTEHLFYELLDAIHQRQNSDVWLTARQASQSGLERKGTSDTLKGARTRQHLPRPSAAEPSSQTEPQVLLEEMELNKKWVTVFNGSGALVRAETSPGRRDRASRRPALSPGSVLYFETTPFNGKQLSSVGAFPPKAVLHPAPPPPQNSSKKQQT